MKIHRESIGHFISWLGRGVRFSLAGYSDAEWYCVLGERDGERTGLGQVLSRDHGARLLDVLRRRQGDDRFKFAVPEVLYTLPSFCDGQIDWFLGSQGIRIEAFERDRLTDDLAREGNLHGLIRAVRSFARTRPVAMVGPDPLAGMQQYLPLSMFVPVSTPNLHLEPGGIERAVERCVRKNLNDALYLVSAGVSAAVIIDQLHDAFPRSWFMDCGSIWDAFVGIGGQREWRAELYRDPEKLEAWKRRCLGMKTR
jgi:hypothetical protein